MSADAWSTCPRCFHKAEEEHRKEVADVMALYGQVPVEEFDAKRAELPDAPRPQHFETFREDYEFWGADTGTLEVSYKGRCTKCGLGVELRDSRPFFVDGKPTAG